MWKRDLTKFIVEQLSLVEPSETGQAKLINMNRISYREFKSGQFSRLHTEHVIRFMLVTGLTAKDLEQFLFWRS